MFNKTEFLFYCGMFCPMYHDTFANWTKVADFVERLITHPKCNFSGNMALAGDLCRHAGTLNELTAEEFVHELKTHAGEILILSGDRTQEDSTKPSSGASAEANQTV